MSALVTEAHVEGHPYSIEGNWTLVPEHIRHRLDAYIGRGERVGGFLTAVLSNDLRDAVCSADEVNLAALRGIVQFLYCDAPIGSHGSPEQVGFWIAQGGLAGRAAAGASS